MNIEPAKPRQPVVDTESLTRDYNRLMTYRKMEGAINTDLAFSNLDTILKQPRRILLEWHLKSMYHVDLSNDWNSLAGKTLHIKRGSPEYERMVTKSLEQVRRNAQAALRHGIDQRRTPESIGSVDSLAKSFDKRMKEIETKFSLTNLPNILKWPEKSLLMVSIQSLFKWKIENNGDLSIWNRTIERWTPEYNRMMSQGLSDFKEVAREMLVDAYNRGVDLETFE